MAANAMRRSRWQLIFLSASVAMLKIGCLDYELPEIEKTTGQTYAEYQFEYEESSVDPIGAPEISICTAFEGD